jgi:hypothetical protein
MVKLNSKGQAALMDSLFFLTIVAAITAMLFFYMTSYGNQMNNQLDAFYTKDFAADSLKVITYVNVLRDGTSLEDYADGGPLKDETPEFDYLLTLMKEDYSDKQEFSGTTIQAIALTLNSVLKPFSSVDYAFYILNESKTDYLFLMFSVHEGELTSVGDKKYDVVYVDRIFYSCKPDSQKVLTKYVTPYVGQVDQSRGKISFVDPDADDSSGKPFIIGLDVWVSKELPAIRAFNPDFHDTLDPEDVQAGRDFNCDVIMECEDSRECKMT